MFDPVESMPYGQDPAFALTPFAVRLEWPGDNWTWDHVGSVLTPAEAIGAVLQRPWHVVRAERCGNPLRAEAFALWHKS